MSFFSNLLESSGCNPDGTIGQNPLTSFVEKSFEFFPSLATTGDDHQSLGSHFSIQNPDSNHQIQAQMHHNSNYQAFPMMTQPPVAPMQYHPGPFPFHQSHSPYPVHFHPYPASYHNQLQHQLVSPLIHEELKVQESFQTSSGEQTNNHISIQEEKSIFGQYEEMIQQANRELNKTNWTILEDDDEIDQLEVKNPSKQGYQEAWQNLERKLESGELSGDQTHLYKFEELNPFLPQQSATISTASATSIRLEQQKESVNIEALYQEALEDFRRGEVHRAVLKLEAIVQQDEGREHAAAWSLLGQCHTENDDEIKAIYSFEKAIEYDPYHLPTLLALGTCYVNELDSIKALETLKTWVSNNPNFHGLEVIQDEYSDGTLMDEVMQLMISVANHSPSNSEVQVLLGVLYNISLDYDSAVDCFMKALEEDPNNYDILNKLGATLANSSRSVQAMPYYAKALEQRPKFARGWRNLGIAYANINDYHPAAKCYLQALHLSPEAKHIWSYLRVVLTCMERLDLVQLSSTENIEELAKLLDVELI